jgi:hypothetical protein
MIRICLGDQSPGDRAWGRGLAEIDGQLYKIALFAGSATEEWSVILQPTLWQVVEEEGSVEDGKISRAIRSELSQPLEEKRVYDPLEEVLKGLKKTNPDLVSAIQLIVNGVKGGEGDDRRNESNPTSGDERRPHEIGKGDDDT